VFSVRYELRFHIPEDGNLYNHHRKDLKSYKYVRIPLHDTRTSHFLLLITYVRFEVFSAVTLKNGVFCVVTACGSCKNRRFGGIWRLLHQGDKNR
jgi:hypothetical protein